MGSWGAQLQKEGKYNSKGLHNNSGNNVSTRDEENYITNSA